MRYIKCPYISIELDKIKLFFFFKKKRVDNYLIILPFFPYTVKPG